MIPDLVLAPFAARFYILEGHREFKPTDVGQKFAEWSKTMQELPEVKRVTSDPEHYVEIYGSSFTRKEALSLLRLLSSVPWMISTQAVIYVMRLNLKLHKQLVAEKRRRRSVVIQR